MKKVLLYFLVLLLIFPVKAYAVSPRSIIIKPNISFTNDIATCTVSITGNSMNDSINAVIKLWKGGNCIAMWSTSGKGYVNFSKNKSVTRDVEYTLSVSATINGNKQPTVSIKKANG